MKIDFGQTMKTIDGKEIPDFDLKKVSINALLANFDDEKNISAEEKLRRFNLANKIYLADGETDLTTEEITLIKKLIGKGFGILIVGQAYKMFESAN